MTLPSLEEEPVYKKADYPKFVSSSELLHQAPAAEYTGTFSSLLLQSQPTPNMVRTKTRRLVMASTDGRLRRNLLFSRSPLSSLCRASVKAESGTARVLEKVALRTKSSKMQSGTLTGFSARIYSQRRVTSAMCLNAEATILHSATQLE